MIGRAEKVCERRNVAERAGERIKRKNCEKLVTGHAVFSFCIYMHCVSVLKQVYPCYLSKVTEVNLLINVDQV